MSIPTVQSTSKSTPTCEKTWDEYITLDLFIAVLQRTFLHPFVAWVVVLSLRAQLTPYGHPAMITAITHATFLTLYTIGKIMSQRMAFGSPRKVDLGEEVVVITGGASGLGLLIAQIYGMRGVSVAVLDVKEAADLEGWQELSGVEYYKCDVGDRKEVEKTAKMIEKDVCDHYRYFCFNWLESMCIYWIFYLLTLHLAAWYAYGADQLRCSRDQRTAVPLPLRKCFQEDNPNKPTCALSYMPDVLAGDARNRKWWYHCQRQLRPGPALCRTSVGLLREQSGP